MSNATKTKSVATKTSTTVKAKSPTANPAVVVTTNLPQYQVVNAAGFKGLNKAVIDATTYLGENGHSTSINSIAEQMATGTKEQGGYFGKKGQASLAYCKTGAKWATQNPKKGIILDLVG